MKFDFLYKIIKDKDRIKLGEEIEFKYLSDGLERIRGKAEALVFPLTTKEVSAVMKFAYDNNICVTPRGAGTGLVGATIPAKGGIVLDLSLMNKIVDLDQNNFTVTVEPGVLLKELQQFVEERGLFYPPDPGEKNASIGGNISTNAGGMRAIKYGVTRDYVRELEVTLADGRVVKLGSKTIKNSSGLDLKDLIIGSEGTIGIVTKALLKLIPKPKKNISVLIPFDSLRDGVNCVIKIIGENANPTAIEFMEKDVIVDSEKFLNLKFPCKLGEAYLLLTFDGDENFEIENSYNKVKKVALKSGALDFILLDNNEIINRTWKIRGALVTAVEAYSEQIPIDIVVPIDKIVDFIDFIKKLQKNYGIKIVSFGHAGDGNIHLCIVRNGMEEQLWNEKSHELLTELYDKTKEMNGLPSGEHGIGLSKKTYFRKVTDEINIELMKKVKEAFDQKGILNPGKVYL